MRINRINYQKTQASPIRVESISKYWLGIFVEHTTIHGIPNLYEASPMTKGFWLSILVFVLSMSIHGCYSIMTEYLVRPIGITYVHQDTVKLPDLIICPFNRLNKNYFQELEVSEQLIDYIETGFIGVPTSFYGFNGEEEASHCCSSIIRYCRLPFGMYDCCQPQYMEYLLTMQGRCVRIKGVIQEMGGYGSGLTIGLRLPYENYLPSRNGFHNNGTLVALVDQGAGLGSNLVMIPDGVHALLPVRIGAYKFTNDPPRYRCKNVDPSIHYSVLQCYDNCLIERAKSICNCTKWHLPDVDYEYCTPWQLYNCLVAEYNRNFEENNNQGRKLAKKCRETCIQPCSYKEYTSVVTYTQFPSDTFHKIIPGQKTQDFEQDIMIDVFYEKLEYTLIEHIPTMTVHEVIGNLGGQIGIWMGASIVSVIQILIFCFQVCIGLSRQPA